MAFRFMAGGILSLMAVGLVCSSAGCAASTARDPALMIAAGTDPGARLEAMVSPVLLDGRSSALDKYLREVGRRLGMAAKSSRGEGVPSFDSARAANVEFHWVEGPTPAVIVVSGRSVYPNPAFLQRCATEDTFAAAIAHAYAHAALGHVTAKLPADGAATSDAELAVAYASAQWTAAEERAADDLGFALYCRAGWSPEGYEQMAQMMAGASSRTVRFRNADGIDQRVAAIRERIDNLPPAAGDWREPPVADSRRFAVNQKASAGVSLIVSGEPTPALRRARLLIAAAPDCSGGAESAARRAARAALQPPPPPPPPGAPGNADNPWGKGLPGR